METPSKEKRDRVAQTKLKQFIETVRSCREPPTKTEIEKFLTKVGVVDIPINHSYKVSDFIAANTDFMYDSKKARYISQTDNPERKSKLIKKWMLPILNRETTRKKLATQLLIPLKF